MNKATAYYTLLSVSGGSARIRAIIRNNIDTGLSFFGFVSGIKKRIFGAAGGRAE